MASAIENLYNAAKGSYDLGSFDEYKESLRSPENRKNLWNALKGKYDLGDFEDFDSVVIKDLGAKKQTYWESLASHNPYPTGGSSLREAWDVAAQKEKQEELQRYQNATLPMSDEEKEIADDIQRLEVQGKYGIGDVTFGANRPVVGQMGEDGKVVTEEVNANQKQIDLLKSRMPEYMQRPNDSEENILANMDDAWQRTEEGRLEKAALNKQAEEFVAAQREEFLQTKEGQELSEKYDKLYNAAFMSSAGEKAKEAISAKHKEYEKAFSGTEEAQSIIEQYRTGKLSKDEAATKYDVAFQKMYGAQFNQEQQSIWKSAQDSFAQSDKAKELQEQYGKDFEEAMKGTLIPAEIRRGLRELQRNYNSKMIAANEDFYKGRMRELNDKIAQRTLSSANSAYEDAFANSVKIIPQQIGAPAVIDVDADYKRAAGDFIYKAKSRLADVSVDKYQAGDFLKNVAYDLGGVIQSTVSFGLSDLADKKILTSIFEKINSKAEEAKSKGIDPEEIMSHPESVLDARELAVYEAYCAYMAADISRQLDTSYWATAAQLTADMIPFMLEVGAMNGIFGGINKAAQEGITRAMVGNIVSHLPRSAGKTFAKSMTGFAVEGVTALLNLGEAAVTALALPRTYANMLDNKIHVSNESPDAFTVENGKLRIGKFDIESTPDAFLKAWRDEAKELFTEQGGFFRLGSDIAFKNPIAKKIYKGVGDTQLGSLIDYFNSGKFFEYAKNFGYHGTFKEWTEEVEGTLYEYMFGDKDAFKKFFSAETQVPMIISFSIPALIGGGFNAGRELMYRHQYGTAYDNVLNILQRHGYSEDDLASIKQSLYMTPTKELPAEVIKMASELIGADLFQKQYNEYAALTLKERISGLTEEEKAKKKVAAEIFNSDIHEYDEVKLLSDELIKLAYAEVAMATVDKGAAQERANALEDIRAYVREWKKGQDDKKQLKQSGASEDMMRQMFGDLYASYENLREAGFKGSFDDYISINLRNLEAQMQQNPQDVSVKEKFLDFLNAAGVLQSVRTEEKIAEQSGQAYTGDLPRGIAPIDTQMVRKERDGITYEVEIDGKKKKVTFRATEYKLNSDDTINLDGAKGVTLQLGNRQFVKENEVEKYIKAINAIRQQKRADAIADAAKRQEQEDFEKTEEYQQQLQQAQKDADLRAEKAEMRNSLPFKNGKFDYDNATPAQIIFYKAYRIMNGKDEYTDDELQADAIQTAIDDILYWYGERETLEKKKELPAKKKDELREIDERIQGYYDAVQKWIGPEAADAVRAAVNQARGIEQAPIQPVQPAQPAAPAAPVVEPKKQEQAETPKQEAPAQPKQPKEKKQETPQQPKAEQPKVEQPAEPTPAKPVSKARKAPGFEEGMDVLAKDVWLVKDSGGRLSLVKSDKKPANAIEKQRVYFDTDGKTPFLLWAYAPVDKTRGTIKYVDAEGNIQEVSRSGVFMEEVHGEDKKIVPVPTPQRKNITTFDTILKSKLKVEGETYTLGDFLTVKKIGSTKKNGGDGVKFLNGYQVIAQHIRERADLTDEQKEAALAVIRGQINDWISSWNSLAKNVLVNATGLKDKDLMPGYAMNLSIYRDTRDKYAVEGEISVMQEVQKRILDMNFQVSSANETNLLRENFFNPLYQMTLMVDIAQQAGILDSAEKLGTSLPDALQRIANSKLVMPKDIEKARSIYAIEKERKHKTGLLEEEFPEVLNNLPALVRFAQPTNEKGKRSQSNKWYDKTLAEVYAKMDAKLKSIEEEKRGGEELKNFNTLLEQAYALATQEKVDEEVVAKLNETIQAELDKHADNPKYKEAFDKMQKRITRHVNSLAKNREAVNRASILQARRDLEAKRIELIKKRDKADKRNDTYEFLEAKADIEDIDKRIYNLELKNVWLADEFRIDQEVAVLQELNNQLEKQNDIMAQISANRVEKPTQADREAERKQNERLGELIQQLSDYEEAHPEAKARLDKMREDAKKAQGLDLSIKPEMAIIDENGIPERTQHTRLVLRALSQVLGWAGIKVYYVGNQEQAREALAQIHGTPELENFESPDGILLGWAIGSDIYLTQEGLNSETPVHEYTHLWVKALQRDNEEAWKNIVALCKKNKHLWDEVKNDPNYESIKNDDNAIASEMLARFSGKNGAKRLEEMARKIAERGGVKSDNLVKSLINNMRNALQEFWRVIKNLLHIDNNVTLDEVADLVLKDLFDGKPLNINTAEMDAIRKEAEANNTFMKAPNGRDSNLTERQWLSVRTKAFKDWYGDWENPKEGEFFLLDENGEPMIVFHGSEEAGFDLFEPQDNGVANGRGIFTTPQRFVAGVYAKLTGEERDEYEAHIGQDEHRGIYSLFANIKNPLIVEGFNPDTEKPSMWNAIPTGIYKIVGAGIETQYYSSYEDALEAYYEQGWGTNPEGTDLDEPEIVPETHTTDEFVELARAQGYDGVIFHDIIDGTDSALLEDLDEDGLYMRAHDVVVALTPNQLKSAIQNNGMFSMEDARIEFQVANRQSQNSDERQRRYIERKSDETNIALADGHYAEEEQVSTFIENAASVGFRQALKQSKLGRARSGISDWAYNRLYVEGTDFAEPVYAIERAIEAWRATKGLEPLSDDDKAYFRLTTIMKKTADQQKRLETELIKPFSDAFSAYLSDVIANSEMYKAYMTERWVAEGQEKPEKLAPHQFFERYLIAKENINRAKDGVDRGLAEFKRRMGVNVLEFVEEFERNFRDTEEHKQQLDALLAQIKQLTDFALDRYLECGRITQEAYDEMKAKDFYIPLQGFEETEQKEDEGMDDDASEAVRFYIGGKGKIGALMQAKGGESMPGSVLSYVLYDAAFAIQYAVKNEAKRAMYYQLLHNAEYCEANGIRVPRELVYAPVYDKNGNPVLDKEGNPTYRLVQFGKTVEEANENRKEYRETIRAIRAKNVELGEAYVAIQAIEEQLAKTKKADVRESLQEELVHAQAYYDGIKETIEELKDSLKYLSPEDSQYLFLQEQRRKQKANLHNTFVSVYVDGIPHVLEFPNNYRAADALNGRIYHNETLAYIKKATSWVALQQTVNNRKFWTNNLTRDGVRVANLGFIKYGRKFIKPWSGNIRKALFEATYYLTTGQTQDSELGILFDQFLKSGAAGSYAEMLDTKKFRAKLRALNPNAWEYMTRLDKLRHVGSGLDDVVSIVELRKIANALNEITELAGRFAVYKTIIDMGLGEAQAVMDAQELPTNLTLHGSGNAFVALFNSTVPFVNAAIQGTVGVGRVLFINPSKEKFARASVVAFGWALLGYMLTYAFGDDDEEKFRPTDYERENYMIIGKNFRFALSEQIRPFWNIGVQWSLVEQGSRTIDEAIQSIVAVAMLNSVPLPQNIITACINEAYNPDYNLGDFAMEILSPAVLEQFGQISRNENFLGNKLRYDSGDIPEYLQAPYESVMFQDLAYLMYRWGGGMENIDSKHTAEGKKLGKGSDINPRELRLRFFWIPPSVISDACLLYGLGKDILKGNPFGTSLTYKEQPVISRVYRPYDENLYTFGVVRDARDIVKDYDTFKKGLQTNMKATAIRMNEARHTGDTEEYQRLYKQLAEIKSKYQDVASDTNVRYLKSLIRQYDGINQKKLAKKYGIYSPNESKQLFPQLDTEEMNKQRDELVRSMAYMAKLWKAEQWYGNKEEALEWYHEKFPDANVKYIK